MTYTTVQVLYYAFQRLELSVIDFTIKCFMVLIYILIVPIYSYLCYGAWSYMNILGLRVWGPWEAGPN